MSAIIQFISILSEPVTITHAGCAIIIKKTRLKKGKRMKRGLIGICVGIIALSFAVPAMAKSAKVPKSMCLKVSGSNPDKIFTLTVSKGGSVKIAANETLKFYTLQGVFDWIGALYIPLTGTGYVKGSTLHFTLHGTYFRDGDPDISIVSAEGFLNLTTLTGSINHAMTNASLGTGGIRFHDELEPVNCSSVTIPHPDDLDTAFSGTFLSDPDESMHGLQ
jgi:hypothetical protein